MSSPARAVTAAPTATNAPGTTSSPPPGNVALRIAGQLRHINAATGELIRELIVDPSKV
jgi:hypothetical protein